jgi:glycosyltransferase involved in cell wall biosynthesis
MHLIVVTDDVLYPTNSGGRSALLGECEALLAAGCEITLVVSHRNAISAAEAAQHERLVSKAVFVPRSGFLRTTLLHPCRPFQLESRGIIEANAARGLGRSDTIGVIASHEWTIPLAHSVAWPLGLNVVLRSHNDEVAYMNALARSASGVRKLYCWAEAARLRAMLKKIYAKISGVAILSEGDAAVYRTYGLEPTHVPAVLFREHDRTADGPHNPPANAQVLFVGALDMPQAVEGLRWFCNEVLPRIRSSVPEAVLHIAGRRPDRELTQFLMSQEGVRFHGEVDDLEWLYAGTRVFINPVFSGSGVNMKVGPPASRGIPIVTTLTGARGLEHLSPGFSIADDEDTFASSCVSLLSDDNLWRNRSQQLRTRVRFVSAESIARGLLQMFEPDQTSVDLSGA